MSGRKIDLGQPFQHLLTIPVVDRAVIEDHDHEREPENRLGAEKAHVRHSRHLHLYGNSDLLLDLFRGAAGPLCNDGDVVIADIGIGLYGQVMKRDSPPGEQQGGNGQHHKPVVQSKIDEGADHFLSAVFLPISLISEGTGWVRPARH